MNVILTGAAGFIGSAFLAHLNAAGTDAVWIVDTAATPDRHANLQGKKFKEYLTREDLIDRLDRGQLKEVEAVIHLGACSDTTEMDRAFLARNNTAYSQRLARWSLERNKRFLYASSASVYGNGEHGYSDADDRVKLFTALNPYGESKLAFDRWVIEEGFSGRVAGFRYFNVFGPNEYHKGDMRSMVCKAFDQIEAGQRVKLFANSRPGRSDGSEERDFVYVKDVNEVMNHFLVHPDRNGIFNVGTGRARSFLDLANAVYRAKGKKPDIEFVPMPAKLRGQYQFFTQADISRLRAAGYDRPFTPLEDAVADYVTNYLTGHRTL
jgi:ADP-L-glycero-D-manno-heptose 6-epimerase